MNIFQKLKSKLPFNKGSVDEDEHHQLTFHAGKHTLTTTTYNEDIICSEIDTAYSGQLIALNTEINAVNTGMLYSHGNPELIKELIERHKDLYLQHIKLIEEISIRYFSEQHSNLKNPFGIAVNTLSSKAFFYNVEKPLVFSG